MNSLQISQRRYRHWHIGTISVVVLLTGCCTPKPTEDPEVAARCTPVSDLLAKNYHRSGALDAFVAGFGFDVDRSGAILSGAEAARVSAVDAACRAWVHHAISDDQYSSVLLGVFSEAIVQTTKMDNRDATTTQNVNALNEFRKTKSVPNSFGADRKLTFAVQRAASLDLSALDQQLQDIINPFYGTLINEMSSEATFRTTVQARFDNIERELAASNKSPASQPVTVPVALPPNTLMVFFSTGSAELTRDSLEKLDHWINALTVSGVKFKVEGYSDPRGEPGRNLALSQRRADAVAQYLTEHGRAAVSPEGRGIKAGSVSDYPSLRAVQITIVRSPAS